MKLVDLMVPCEYVVNKALHEVSVALAQVLEVAHVPLMLRVVIFPVEDLLIVFLLRHNVDVGIFVFFVSDVRSRVEARVVVSSSAQARGSHAPKNLAIKVTKGCRAPIR